MTEEAPPPRPSLLRVVYASQGGNGVDLAQQIEEIGRRLRLPTELCGADEYDMMHLFDDRLVVFVVSTTGQGCMPDSLRRGLWRVLLRAGLPDGLLDGLHFAAFGLGDSSYLQFNWAIKKLRRRLCQLGACELLDHGLGDAQHPQGPDTVFIPWIERLKVVLYRIANPCGEPEWMPLSARALLPPRCAVEASAVLDATPLTFHRSHKLYKLTQNMRITSRNHWQDVRHVVLTPPNDGFAYQPGDIAVLHPVNDDESVSRWLDVLGWTEIANSVLDIAPRPPWIVSPVTLRLLGRHYLDILSPPRRSFFANVWHFASDPDHAEKLYHFSTIDGQEDLFAYINRPRRNLLEVLVDFKPSLCGNIPLTRIFDLFLRLQGRQFSIASEYRPETGNIELCVALVRYRTVMATERRGVCSRWLETLAPGDEVEVNLQNGDLALPRSPDTPVILVGPGTGIAPLRAIIQSRISAHAPGQMLLFFGCRSQFADFHFRDEWTALGGRLRVITAFSRDNPERAKKYYVQDAILDHAQTVYTVLAELGGYMYVCGSSGHMPESVRAAICQAYADYSGLDSEQALLWLKQLESTGRYFQETW